MIRIVTNPNLKFLKNNTEPYSNMTKNFINPKHNIFTLGLNLKTKYIVYSFEKYSGFNFENMSQPESIKI